MWSDIGEFESLIKQADQQDGAEQADLLQRAIDLYRGDLLEGCYEDWCLEARESFRNLYTNALKKLVDFHTSRPGHDLRYALDGTRMADMDWTPPMTIEDTVASTVRWTLDRPEWLSKEA